MLELISVLRNAQLSSPGAFPDNRHGGEGIRLAAQTCLLGTQRPGAGLCPCYPGSVMMLSPWSCVRGFWGQLQVD